MVSGYMIEYVWLLICHYPG